MSRRVLVILALVAVLDLVASRTVVLKESDVISEGIPKVHVGADGVSASFGGYSASAGLGGQVGGSSGAGGGLYARAGTPDGTGASAGLGGSLNPGGEASGGLYAGAGVGSGGDAMGNIPPSQPGNKIRPNPTLYNDIFNIPTSILGAVNRLLTGGVNAVANIGSTQGHAEVGAGVGGSSKPEGAVKPVGGGAHVQVGASAGTGGTAVRTTQGFFNDIFNIPITALNAVNQLLNNNPKNGK